MSNAVHMAHMMWSACAHNEHDVVCVSQRHKVNPTRPPPSAAQLVAARMSPFLCTSSISSTFNTHSSLGQSHSSLKSFTGANKGCHLCLRMSLSHTTHRLQRMLDDKTAFAALIISRRQDEFEALKKAR